MAKRRRYDPALYPIFMLALDGVKARLKDRIPVRESTLDWYRNAVIYIRDTVGPGSLVHSTAQNLLTKWSDG